MTMRSILRKVTSPKALRAFPVKAPGPGTVLEDEPVSPDKKESFIEDREKSDEKDATRVVIGFKAGIGVVKLIVS